MKCRNVFNKMCPKETEQGDKTRRSIFNPYNRVILVRFLLSVSSFYIYYCDDTIIYTNNWREENQWMEYGVESIVLKKRGGFAEPVVLFLIIVSVEQQNKRSGSGLYSQGLWSVFDLIIGSSSFLRLSGFFSRWSASPSTLSNEPWNKIKTTSFFTLQVVVSQRTKSRVELAWPVNLQSCEKDVVHWILWKKQKHPKNTRVKYDANHESWGCLSFFHVITDHMSPHSAVSTLMPDWHTLNNRSIKKPRSALTYWSRQV